MKVRSTPYFKIKAGSHAVIYLKESFGFVPEAIILEAKPNKNAHLRVNALIPEEGGKNGKSKSSSSKSVN